MGTNVIGRTGRTTLTVASAAGIGLLIAACSSGSSSSSSSTAYAAPSYATSSSGVPAATTGQGTGAVLRTEKTGMGTVLADAKGYTVYWFGADHGSTSSCTGACAAAWPPVIGTPSAASGVTLPGKLGTITRSGGQKQATYNGHPLYTFKADAAPGQTNGNGVASFGATWYLFTISASGGAGSSPSPTASSSGYGGY